MADDAVLNDLGRRYLWWQSPLDVRANQPRLLCQLMQLGTYEDVRTVRAMVGDDAFRAALTDAPAGALDARSWNFWHLVLFRHEAPPLPTRPIPP